MAEQDPSTTTKRVGPSKWALTALGVTAVLVVAFVLIIIFYGVYAGDLRGESIFPGP